MTPPGGRMLRWPACFVGCTCAVLWSRKCHPVENRRHQTDVEAACPCKLHDVLWNPYCQILVTLCLAVQLSASSCLRRLVFGYKCFISLGAVICFPMVFLQVSGWLPVSAESAHFVTWSLMGLLVPPCVKPVGCVENLIWCSVCVAKLLVKAMSFAKYCNGTSE